MAWKVGLLFAHRTEVQENPSSNKTKHSLSLEILATIVYIYNISQLFLAAADNQVSTYNSATVANKQVSSNKI